MNSDWTERTCSWAFVSTPSSPLLYIFIFLKHLHPHCCFHFCWRKGRAEQRGLRLVSGFQATWLAAGSIWSCEEGLPTLTSEETNICLKGQKRREREYERVCVREREKACVRERKKILISLQTRWEIKAGKTYPSKGCSVSCKMEIFPKLTDPVGCWQSWREEHMQVGRCTAAEPDVESALTSVHTLTYSKGN